MHFTVVSEFGLLGLGFFFLVFTVETSGYYTFSLNFLNIELIFYYDDIVLSVL